MSDPLSKTLRANLTRIANMDDPQKIIAWDEGVRVYTHEARAILEAVDTIEGLRGALDMGKLSDELVRVLLAQATTETIDLTSPLSRKDYEDTQPLGDKHEG